MSRQFRTIGDEVCRDVVTRRKKEHLLPEVHLLTGVLNLLRDRVSSGRICCHTRRVDGLQCRLLGIL
jgi:hypothetical protein